MRFEFFKSPFLLDFGKVVLPDIFSTKFLWNIWPNCLKKAGEELRFCSSFRLFHKYSKRHLVPNGLQGFRPRFKDKSSFSKGNIFIRGSHPFKGFMNFALPEFCKRFHGGLLGKLHVGGVFKRTRNRFSKTF